MLDAGATVIAHYGGDRAGQAWKRRRMVERTWFKPISTI
jgi:hypothetical protein